jgi:hypothetical protein
VICCKMDKMKRETIEALRGFEEMNYDASRIEY